MRLYGLEKSTRDSLREQRAAARAKSAPRKNSAEELLEVETIVHRTLYLARRPVLLKSA